LGTNSGVCPARPEHWEMPLQQSVRRGESKWGRLRTSAYKGGTKASKPEQEGMSRGWVKMKLRGRVSHQVLCRLKAVGGKDIINGLKPEETFSDWHRSDVQKQNKDERHSVEEAECLG